MDKQHNKAYLFKLFLEAPVLLVSAKILLNRTARLRRRSCRLARRPDCGEERRSRWRWKASRVGRGGRLARKARGSLMRRSWSLISGSFSFNRSRVSYEIKKDNDKKFGFSKTFFWMFWIETFQALFYELYLAFSWREFSIFTWLLPLKQHQQQQQQQHWWKMMLRRAESIFIDDFQAYANCHLTHSDVRRTK